MTQNNGPYAHLPPPPVCAEDLAHESAERVRAGVEIARGLMAEAGRIEREQRALTPDEAAVLQAAEFLRRILPHGPGEEL